MPIDGTKEDLLEKNNNRTVLSVVVEEDDYNLLHDEEDEERQPRAVRSATEQMIGLLSITYAIFLALMGLLFTLASSVNDRWLNDMHSEGIFAVYVYTSGTAFLLALQLYVIPKSKGNHIEAETRRMNKVRASIANTLPGRPLSTMRTNNVCENGYEGPLLRISSTLNVNSVTVSPSVFETDTVASQVWVDVRKLNDAFAQKGTTTTFYLRLGTLLFGLGNIVYVGLEIHYYLILPAQKNCDVLMYGWKFVLRLIFIMAQTFFILKNDQVHVTIFTKVARFGFMHLIATNFYVWFHTLVSEILHELYTVDQTHEPYDSFEEAPVENDAENHQVHIITTTIGHKINATGHYGNCNLLSSMRNNATPFLFPCILQYSLVSAGIFTLMCSEVGQIEPSAFLSNLRFLLQKCTNKKDKFEHYLGGTTDGNADETDQNQETLHSSGTNGYLTFKRSHRGMFAGFVHLALMIVATVVFFSEVGEGNKQTAICAFYVCDVFTHAILLITSVAALFHLNKLQLQPKPMSVYDIILLTAMGGACFLELSQILSMSSFALNNHLTGMQRINAALVINDTTLTIVQTLVQVVLIISGLRRFSIHGSYGVDGEDMPGREEVTFLIIANVTVWIFRSIHIKELELDAMSDFYGEFAWLIIVNINLPLLLFFRFHSSVCLAEIWSSAYIPRKLGVQREPPSTERGFKHALYEETRPSLAQEDDFDQSTSEDESV